MKDKSTKIKNKIIAIGDVHGCYSLMTELVGKLLDEYDGETCTFVFLGDYVDRGPDAKNTISQLIAWEKKYPHWKFLYGNHEDLMLDALIGDQKIYHSYDLWWNQGGKETAHSYFPEGMSKYDMAISQPMDHIKWQHLNWLRTRPLYFDSDEFFFVHAGLLPGMSIEEHKQALEKGNEDIRQEMLWIRDQFIDSDYDWGKRIIFGHTADYDGDFRPIVRENKIGIDTAPCPPSLNALTAIVLPEERFVSCSYKIDEKIPENREVL